MVPTFFLLSGYLFYQNFAYSELKRKWKSRLFSLVIPYCIWNVIAYFYYEIIYNIPAISSHINQSIEPFSAGNLIRNVLWGYHNITWFLRYLIVYTFTVPFLYPVIKRKRIGVIFIILLSVVNHYYDIGGVGYLRYGIIYLIGAWIGCNLTDVVRKKYNLEAPSIIYLFFSTIIASIIPTLIHKDLYNAIRVSQAIAIWLLADIFYTDRKPKWWMKISFFIYCSHSIVLESLEKIILIIFGKNQIGATIDFIIASPVTICIIIGAAWIIQKYPLLWKVLSGNRR